MNTVLTGYLAERQVVKMVMQNRNVEIFVDTLQQVDEKYPIKAVNLRYYKGNLERLPRAPKENIVLLQQGTVEAGYQFAETTKVAILNFADALQCGGLVWIGEVTQEENICRCSNLYPYLDNDVSLANYYKPNRQAVREAKKEIYTDNIIYVKNAVVFKDDKTYEEVAPRELDIITCPAPSSQLGDNAMGIYLTRIEQIVLSAIANDVKVLVLGAWGCGAFGQSPETVARAFSAVLKNYSGYFDKVVFAIRPTPAGGTYSNYTIFKAVLRENFKEIAVGSESRF